MAILVRFRPAVAEGGQALGALLQTALGALLETMVFLNVILAAFNALPIPPLDGSRVADALVPEALWHLVRLLGG